MADPQFVPITELKQLFDPAFVASRKIESIKMLRRITGEGLRETKDFFEQIIQPAIAKNSQRLGDQGAIPNPISSTFSDENLAPPMFLVGMTYLQLDKTPALIVGVANYGTSYETVYSINSTGEPIHRYNRRDFGRVTGTDADNPSPYNLKRLDL